MKKKTVLLLLVAAVLSGDVSAQLPWPAVTQTTKPWTRWWWEGSAVNKKGLTAAMEKYRLAGLGGLEITPIYGVKGYESQFIDFLSPKWMEMFSHTLSEGKRLNLGIDMANGTGWPFGGPLVTPEDACRNINSKVYELNGGEQLKEKISFTQTPFYRSESRMKIDINQLSYPVATNKDLQLYALDQVRYEKTLKADQVLAYNEKGEMLDITTSLDADGQLNWTAPIGKWKIYALFIGWHGKLVERAAPGGEGDVIDHFNAVALKHYLDRFDKAFAGKDISGLRAFFNDSYEVDDARGQGNWSPILFKEFQKRRGYDLKQYIPQLLGRDSSETGRRVLVDYRQTISDLLLDNFTRPWHQWAKAKGKMIRNQSHGSPANILDLYAVVDMPETEGADILRFKFATSTAHVMGKPLAAAETATWLNEHFQSSLGDVKQAVDKYFVGGVNHVVWHGTNYSPADDPWPGWLFYAAVHFTPANSFWRNFSTLNNYVASCQSFLQKGKSDNDLLLYFPFSDKLYQMDRDLLQHFDGMAGFDNTVFKSSAEWLLNKGYAFDLVSDKQLQSSHVVSNNIQTAGGKYQTILLSNTRHIPLATMEWLLHSAMQGATIVFYKDLPADVPGLSDLQKKQQNMQALLSKLHFTNIAGTTVRKAPVGKGRFLLGDDLQELLTTANTNRETLTDKGLQFTRRVNAEGHCYFISNPGKTAVNEWVPVTAKEKLVSIYDPMKHIAGIAKTRTVNDQVEVLLQLAAGESCVLQTGYTPVKGAVYPYQNASGEPIAISGSWEISFLEGGPVLPQKANLTALGSWTELNDTGAKKFSGTAQYSIHFAKPEIAASHFVLDLGRVEESAEIILNGRRIDTLLGPVFRVTIPAAWLKTDNLLQVNVTNGMANRIADMDKQGIAWKKFYNTNFPSRLPQNRGADGIFTAAAWEPKPSGLFGPVSLQPVVLNK
jgi:hypothetical protein